MKLDSIYNIKMESKNLNFHCVVKCVYEYNQDNVSKAAIVKIIKLISTDSEYYRPGKVFRLWEDDIKTIEILKLSREEDPEYFL